MKELEETKKHIHGGALQILQKHELRQVNGGNGPPVWPITVALAPGLLTYPSASPNG